MPKFAVRASRAVFLPHLLAFGVPAFGVLAFGVLAGGMAMPAVAQPLSNPPLTRAPVGEAPASATPVGAAPVGAAPGAKTTLAPAQPRDPMALSPSEGSVIVAIVNGEVISQADVDNRRRLFALSTGLPVTQDVLDRLTPQVIRQLVDERLRLQEVLRRHIVVSDQEIAQAIGEIEQQNNMPAGALRQRLAKQGVPFRTLIDQLRVQLGWGRVLREKLGSQTVVTDADIAQQAAILKAQTGQPEFNVGEIFVSVSDPANTEDARRFSDTVIQQLRAGAAFPVVAAEFSQAQNALQGGELGWVQPSQLDPAVLRVLQEMPVGAISNPIAVPGGFSIVTLRAKRQIGSDPATMIDMRQVLFRFNSPLDPANPTAQQRDALEQARKLAASVKDCAGMEAAAKAAGDPKAGNPGELRLEGVAVPALRNVMATLPIGKASEPLVANDGVAVMMVCSRDTKNLGVPDRKAMADTIVAERVELASRQLMRDLERRAMIDRRT